MVALKNLISMWGMIFIIWQDDKIEIFTLAAFLVMIILYGVCFIVKCQSEPKARACLFSSQMHN